jgi:hypothetical protein
MGDEEDKETIFQEAAKRAWVRVFIREASKRGYPIENIVALDEPGMTAEAVVERILSTREPKAELGRREGIFSPARASVPS